MSQPGLPHIIIRPFHNSDLPKLVEIWNGVKEFAGLRHPVDCLLFNQTVLSKPFFDRRLFLVAVDTSVENDLPHDGKIIGFGHGGFSPNSDFSGEDKTRGCIAMIMAEQELEEAFRMQVSTLLLKALEAEFKRQGAKVILAGAIYPDAPFYIGMYLSGESPGIHQDTQLAHTMFKENRYQLYRRFHILYIDLHEYRVKATIRGMKIQNQYDIRMKRYSVPATWWAAAALNMLECKRYELYPKVTVNDDLSQPPPCHASVMVQMITHQGSEESPQRCLGIHHVEVAPEFRQQGLGTFLVKKILEAYTSPDHAKAEIMVPEDNETASGMFFSLEPESASCGLVYQKRIAPE